MANCKIYMTAEDARNLTIQVNKEVKSSYSDLQIKDVMKIIENHINVTIPNWKSCLDDFTPTEMMKVNLDGILRPSVANELRVLGYVVYTEKVAPIPEYQVVSWDV